MLVFFVVILLLTIGFQGGSEGVFIGLQGLVFRSFSALVFPLLEPMLIINHLRHNQYYAHTVFARHQPAQPRG